MRFLDRLDAEEENIKDYFRVSCNDHLNTIPSNDSYSQLLEEKLAKEETQMIMDKKTLFAEGLSQQWYSEKLQISFDSTSCNGNGADKPLGQLQISSRAIPLCDLKKPESTLDDDVTAPRESDPHLLNNLTQHFQKLMKTPEEGVSGSAANVQKFVSEDIICLDERGFPFLERLIQENETQRLVMIVALIFV